jgi:predicted TIM-barrel fold metal-dependent hydrolase
MIVDVDTHVDEPHDLWTQRMSTKWGDLVPRIRYDDATGMDSWFVGDQRIGSATHSTMMPGTDPDVPVRWPHASPNMPKSMDDVHPSAYDAGRRVKVMDRFGIQTAAVYPNQNFIARSIHAAVKDPAFQVECLRAYNDWLLEWVAPYPDRYIPLACIPYWDVPSAIAEIERCAELGFKGVVSTGTPHLPPHHCPTLSDRSWDPMWRAAETARLPISFHVGGGDASRHASAERVAVEGARAHQARAVTAVMIENALAFNELLLSGVLPRFPDLKFVAVEAGIGWVPFVLDAADYNFHRAKVWRDRPEFQLTPTDYFHRQIFTTFWFERLEPLYVERVGAENILFETDYPHQVCLDGEGIQEILRTAFVDVSDAVREQVLWGNAAALYGLSAPAPS